MQIHRTIETLYVPLDIGKNVHCYGVYAGADLQEIVPPQEIRAHRGGYERFRSALQRLAAMYPQAQIIVGWEPTGVYHEPWAYGLLGDCRQLVDLQRVNPYRTRQKRKQLHSRAEHKSDRIDVLSLAYCLRDGNGRPFQVPALGVQALALWCRRYGILRRDRQRLANRLRSQLDRLWPGMLADVPAFRRAHPTLESPEPLVATQPFKRRLVQTLLKVDPNPYTWQALSETEIRAKLRAGGMRCGPKTAQKVARVAQNAMLLPPSVVELLAEQVRQDFENLQQTQATMARLRCQAEAQVQRLPGAVIATVPGLSAFQAAQYVGLVGEAERFEHADQVWALVGFDVVQNDSGDRRRRGKLTKQGAAYGRAVLFQMGLSASMACPAIGRAKQRALKRGKTKVEATLHAAHKTNRICFHLYRQRIPFDANKLH